MMTSDVQYSILSILLHLSVKPLPPPPVSGHATRRVLPGTGAQDVQRCRCHLLPERPRGRRGNQPAAGRRGPRRAAPDGREDGGLAASVRPGHRVPLLEFDRRGGLPDRAGHRQAPARLPVRFLFRHHFGPFLAHFSAPPHPTRAACCDLLGGHADRVLVGGWNPML